MNPGAGMTRVPRAPRVLRAAGGGFSLVELLLAVALIGLLLGAVAFNFATLQRGARLEEGANQVEALLRYARAHAAATGHRVRINFEEDVGEGLLVPLGNLSVTWEPDPLARPGVFEPLAEAAPYVDAVLDGISIELVRPMIDGSIESVPPGPPAFASTGLADGAGDLAGDKQSGMAATDSVEPLAAFAFPPITFQPDGSSDSVELTIAPRDDDGQDARRMVIRLIGLTGSIRRRVLVPDLLPGSPAKSEHSVDSSEPTVETSEPSAVSRGTVTGAGEEAP